MGQPSEKQILLSDYQAARNVADLALKREEELVAQLAALRAELAAERKRGEEMRKEQNIFSGNAIAVYERFKHFDVMLSNEMLLTMKDEDGNPDVRDIILFELWGFVKRAALDAANGDKKQTHTESMREALEIAYETLKGVSDAMLVSFGDVDVLAVNKSADIARAALDAAK